VDVEQIVLADYPHIDEDNPLSESLGHWNWGTLIANSARDGLAGRDVTVMGNVLLRGEPDAPRVAPDVMVVPVVLPAGQRSYRPGVDGPPPLACVEVLSVSNTPGDIERRGRRMIALGCPEVYVVDIDGMHVEQLVVDPDGSARRVDVMGRALPGLGLAFARDEHGGLAVCCPGGRLATPELNPWSELRDETARADRADRRADDQARRADDQARRADEAEREVAALRAEIERLRSGS
jgi:Uma2 family endonuclease